MNRKVCVVLALACHRSSSCIIDSIPKTHCSMYDGREVCTLIRKTIIIMPSKTSIVNKKQRSRKTTCIQSPRHSPTKMSGIECHGHDACDDNFGSGDEDTWLMGEYEKRPPWKFSWSKPHLKKTGMSETMRDLMHQELLLSTPPFIASPPRSPTKKKKKEVVVASLSNHQHHHRK